MILCVFLAVIVFLLLNINGISRSNIGSGGGEVSEPAVNESITDATRFDDERDYSDYVEIDLDDFPQYQAKASETYHSLMGKRLENYKKEVRISGYVVSVDRDNYSVYKVSDSQSLDDNSDHIKVGCWTDEVRYPEKGYSIGDYITVQGSIDYIFTQGEIIIRCSFMEKEGKRFEEYDYDKNKSYVNMTVSEIKDNFSASIVSLETVLPRNKLIKTSGYYVEGPSADFGTAVALSKDKVEDWGHSSFQVGCLGVDYSWIKGIKNGDYVTWWVYFGNNWHRSNNCVVAKIEKTPSLN